MLSSGFILPMISVTIFLVIVIISIKIRNVIHGRENALVALNKEREKVDKLFEVAHVILIAVNADESVGKINKKGLEILGYDEAQVVGRNWFDDFVPDKVRDYDRKQFHEIISANKKNIRSYESLVQDNCGKEKIIIWNVSLMTDDDAKVTGTLSSGEDITDRKETEKESNRTLREYRELAEILEKRNREIDHNREELQAALDEVSSLIMKVEGGENGDIRFQNPYLIKCYSEMDCHKTSCPCYEKGETRCWQISGTYCGNKVQGTFAQKYESCTECNVFKKATNNPIFMIGEHFNNMMHLIEMKRATLEMEISERKKAEKKQDILLEEIKHVNQELNDFAYVVSHDLKAPLRAIGSLASWIASDYMDKFDEDGKEQLNLLTGRVRRMHSLIDGILQYSRVGRIREEKSEVDLNELIPVVIDSISPPEHIHISVDDKLPTILCENTRIEQVFQNLISNAVKYMDKPEGRVRIGCTGENGHWKFSVSDNGPGIEEKYHDKVFQIFQTLSPRDEYESTGIGLTLVKKIVEMYGGRLWVESEVGNGCSFYFSIPRQGNGTVQ